MAGIDPKAPELRNLVAIFIEFPGMAVGRLAGPLLAQFIESPLRQALENKMLLWRPDGINTLPNPVSASCAEDWFHGMVYLSNVPRGLETIKAVLEDLCVLPLSHIALRDFDTGDWQTWYAYDLTEPFENRDQRYWAAINKARAGVGLPPINRSPPPRGDTPPGGGGFDPAGIGDAV